MLGLVEKRSNELVGVLDWMEENPLDGVPWVGLLLVRADRQRAGLAREAFEGLTQYLRGAGALCVRAAVIERNAAGYALARSLGLTGISRKTMRMATEESVVVVERRL